MPLLRKIIARCETSIQAKLSAIVIAAVVTATIAGSMTATFRDAARRFHSKQAELAGISAALSASLAHAVAENDRAAAARPLSAVRRLPAIVFARVTDSAGRPMIELGHGVMLERPDERVRPNAEISALSKALLRNILIETPIINGGRNVGSLQIIADVSDLRSAFTESLFVSLLTGAFAVLLGLLVAGGLRRSLTRPIAEVTAAMEHIRASRDFSRLVPKSSNDETGRMVDAFNEMLNQIRVRDHELARNLEHLESEVEARTRELKSAKVAAEHANAAKSDFLATMSHEIRTPLNGMLVMAELMATGELSEVQARSAGVILASGQSLLAIINDILDLSKIEAGRLELECLSVDPVVLAGQAAELFSARAAGKGLDLAYSAGPGVPATIAADPVRLNQVLSNLVNNALKFTETGHVAVHIALVDGTGEAGTRCRLRFSVSDSGIGIPAEKIATIFEPFSQADQSITRRFGGTGIGLTIVRRLVEAMGGEIKVDSAEGKGSCFHFTISVEVLTAGEVTALVPGPGLRAVVAASAATAQAIRDGVGRLGFDTVAADEVESFENAPLIFAEAVRFKSIADQISARDGLRPVVALLAEVGDTAASTLAASGIADVVLMKPVSPADISRVAEAVRDGDLSRLAPQRRAPVIRNEGPQFAGTHVLAADDNPVNREVVSEALKRLGVVVTLAEDGNEAVAACAARSFDLVLMDLSMPGMDGLEAARAIRAREAEAGADRMPIIALTAQLAGSAEDGWRTAGMNGMLSKPFTLKALAQCLETWVTPARCEPGRSGREAGPNHAAAVTEPLRPVLNPEVLADIRAMQGPGGDLVGRIVGLFQHHAPPALQRLRAALSAHEAGQATGEEVAAAAHAMKSLCRNIGAERLGDYLDVIEGTARVEEPLATLVQLGALEPLLSETLVALAAFKLAETGEARDIAAA